MGGSGGMSERVLEGLMTGLQFFFSVGLQVESVLQPAGSGFYCSNITLSGFYQ